MLRTLVGAKKGGRKVSQVLYCTNLQAWRVTVCRADAAL